MSYIWFIKRPMKRKKFNIKLKQFTDQLKRHMLVATEKVVLREQRRSKTYKILYLILWLYSKLKIIKHVKEDQRAKMTHLPINQF